MSLLADVTAALREHGTPFAVIGAAAMAVHGVTRSTRDLDLFTLERECLSPAYWQRLVTAGIDVSIRRGDADDPLAGVVRVSVVNAPPVDVIVGKSPWQEPIVTAPVDAAIEGVSVPVARTADLILLKLYAGGPQDAWDIAQLLSAAVGDATIDEVERRLDTLPPECRRLWARIRAGGA